MVYGAGVIYDPNHPKVARGLQASQNKGLRKVLGAYKATPTRNLELEAFCPPLDLYFNKRLADFASRGSKPRPACLLHEENCNTRGFMERQRPLRGGLEKNSGSWF